MPRLFTALEIPPQVAQSLAMMRGGLPGARWIDPENYHLTLRFIGDIDDALAHEIAGMLGRQFGKVETMLRAAEAEVTAFADFPVSHWKKIWSTNPLERVNKEIKRRTDVVGVFPNPAALFIQPDHYIFRMLYSQGISLESLGIPQIDGKQYADPREVWRIFAKNYYLFRGTPTRLWFDYSLSVNFGLTDRLSPENADAYYDAIDRALQTPEFRPRALRGTIITDFVPNARKSLSSSSSRARTTSCSSVRATRSKPTRCSRASSRATPWRRSGHPSAATSCAPSRASRSAARTWWSAIRS